MPTPKRQKRKANRYDWQSVLTVLPAAIAKFKREYLGVLPLIREVFYNLTVMDKNGELAAEGLLPNVKKAYKQLDHMLVRWRTEGKVEWGTFRTDESRDPVGGDHWDVEPIDYADAVVRRMRDAVDGYGLSFWARQGHQVVIACEKVGQKELIASIVDKYYVRVIPGRGYAAWESWAAEREEFKMRELPIIVLYVGEELVTSRGNEEPTSPVPRELTALRTSPVADGRRHVQDDSEHDDESHIQDAIREIGCRYDSQEIEEEEDEDNQTVGRREA